MQQKYKNISKYKTNDGFCTKQRAVCINANSTKTTESVLSWELRNPEAKCQDEDVQCQRGGTDAWTEDETEVDNDGGSDTGTQASTGYVYGNSLSGVIRFQISDN